MASGAIPTSSPMKAIFLVVFGIDIILLVPLDLSGTVPNRT